jgi:hypothetical protein
MTDARERMRELQRMADRVCTLILSSDLPAIDIEIEKNKVPLHRCRATETPECRSGIRIGGTLPTA